MRRLALLLLLFPLVLPLAAQPAKKRPMQIEDLFKFQRVSDPRQSLCVGRAGLRFGG